MVEVVPYLHKCLEKWIYINGFAFCILGFAELTFCGVWMADNISVTVLLQDAAQDNQEVIDDLIGGMSVDPVAVAVGGLVQVVLSFAVCCVSCCELRSLYKWNCAAFLLIFLYTAALITVAVLKLQTIDEIRDQITAALQANLRNLYSVRASNTSGSRFTFEMDGFQAENGCCGASSYLDYANATTWKQAGGANLTVPETCCRLDLNAFLFKGLKEFTVNNCTTKPTPDNSYIAHGCDAKVTENMKRDLLVGTIVFFSLSGMLLLLTTGLFIWQIRHVDETKQDPFSELQDAATLAMKELEDEVKHIQDLNEDKAEQEDESALSHTATE